MSPTKLKVAAGEHKRPQTKIVQYKHPKGNVKNKKVAEVVNARRKQER